MINQTPKPSDPAVDWARRVNQLWIVHSRLRDNASAWLDHLEFLNDPRLQASCQAAKSMCSLRHKSDDPKPWFYVGLFSLANPEEANRFLASHRVTQAAVPATADDESVRLWLDHVSPETRQLIHRLRKAIAQIH